MARDEDRGLSRRPARVGGSEMKSPYLFTGTRSTHVVVWEAANGPVPKGYVVHHRDHDKHNNELSNLELMTHQAHSEHHNQKHPRVKTCEVCSVEYEPAPTKRARSRTCSKPCHKVLLSRLATEREAKRRSAA